MTSSQQSAALRNQIWKIANDVRGAVDGWDFKQYVLGTLFYRFISENFAAYIEDGDDSVTYAELPDCPARHAQANQREQNLWPGLWFWLAAAASQKAF